MATRARALYALMCTTSALLAFGSPAAHAQSTVTDLPSAPVLSTTSSVPKVKGIGMAVQFKPISADVRRKFDHSLPVEQPSSSESSSSSSTESSSSSSTKMSFIPKVTSSTSTSKSSSSAKSTSEEDVLPPDIGDMDAEELASSPEGESMDIGDMDVSYSGTNAEKVVKLALSKVGTPYVWGATGPDTFDCSGLIQWAYGKVGITLPRVSWDQIGGSEQVSVNAVQPGDVIGYSGGDHVAMYIGNGEVVHAPQPGENVKVSSLDMMPVESVTRWAK